MCAMSELPAASAGPDNALQPRAGAEGGPAARGSARRSARCLPTRSERDSLHPGLRGAEFKTRQDAGPHVLVSLGALSQPLPELGGTHCFATPTCMIRIPCEASPSWVLISEHGLLFVHTLPLALWKTQQQVWKTRGLCEKMKMFLVPSLKAAGSSLPGPRSFSERNPLKPQPHFS